MSMPSQASTSLLRNVRIHGIPRILIVSMPSRASTSLLPLSELNDKLDEVDVSMPSRASTSLLLDVTNVKFLDFHDRVNALSG